MIFFYVHPYLGKISMLTNMFQRGWKDQLVILNIPTIEMYPLLKLT